jgi:transcriptional regulator with XRE-family HTH domain
MIETLDRTIAAPADTYKNGEGMTLGERIRQLRVLARPIRPEGYSIAELAAAVGVTVQSVYQWEKGETKGLKPDNLVAVAEFLGVTVEYLVTGAETPVAKIVRHTVDPLPLHSYVFVESLKLQARAGHSGTSAELDAAMPVIFNTDILVERGIRSPGLAFIRASGDDRELGICNGAFVMIDREDCEIDDGKDYLLYYNREWHLKRVFKRIGGGLILRADHQQMEVDGPQATQVEVVGRVRSVTNYL